jgi:hypothetical protein
MLIFSYGGERTNYIDQKVTLDDLNSLVKHENNSIEVQAFAKNGWKHSIRK